MRTPPTEGTYAVIGYVVGRDYVYIHTKAVLHLQMRG